MLLLVIMIITNKNPVCVNYHRKVKFQEFYINSDLTKKIFFESMTLLFSGMPL